MSASQDKSREEQTSTLRESINNAYGFLKGSETIATFRTMTFEEMMQRQLDRLAGTNGKDELQRIAKIQTDLTGAIQAIKAIPQDQVYNGTDGVNPK